MCADQCAFVNPGAAALRQAHKTASLSMPGTISVNTKCRFYYLS